MTVRNPFRFRQSRFLFESAADLRAFQQITRQMEQAFPAASFIGMHPFAVDRNAGEPFRVFRVAQVFPCKCVDLAEELKKLLVFAHFIGGERRDCRFILRPPCLLHLPVFRKRFAENVAERNDAALFLVPTVAQRVDREFQGPVEQDLLAGACGYTPS